MWKWRLAAMCVLAVLMVVYLLTLAPSLTWTHYGADGGDLVTAVARGSIPHPPGFPTYLLLGELFLRLPWRDPAWRLNLMSAMLAAGTAALTATAVGFLPCSRISQEVGSAKQNARDGDHTAAQSAIRDLQTAICIGLTLGLAPLLWSQALITEVYAPAAFFTALVVVIALRGGPAWGLGLAWGIGMGVHPTLLLLVPMVVWGIWGDRRKRLERCVQTGLLVVLSCGIMYGPMLLTRGKAPSPWGDVSTLAGWWALVSGRLYHSYLFGLVPAAWAQRLLVWAGLVTRQFTPIGAVLTGLGWLHLRQDRRALAIASALSSGAFSFYAIGYDTADSLVYLVPALPLLALWLGTGLAHAADRLEKHLRHGARLILLLPLLQAVLVWGQIDLSGDHAATDWAERVLEEAPYQAMLLTSRDAHTFTLWYVHEVLNERPDVVVVDRDLWDQEPYRWMLAEELGLASADADLSPEEAAYRARRPIVRVTDHK